MCARRGREQGMGVIGGGGGGKGVGGVGLHEDSRDSRTKRSWIEYRMHREKDPRGVECIPERHRFKNFAGGAVERS